MFLNEFILGSPHERRQASACGSSGECDVMNELGDVRLLPRSSKGASKPHDWAILSVPVRTVRNGVGDSIKMELFSILKGEQTHTRRSGITGWTTCLRFGDPNMWVRPTWEDCIS